METQTQAPPTESKGSKFLAGVGIVALLLAAIWLGVQAVQFGSNVTSGIAGSFSGVRSLFGGNDELVLAADPGVVASTESFVLSWEQTGDKEEGSYTFNYKCAPGVHLEASVSKNNGNVVFCNTPFNFINADDTLELSAVTANEEPTEVALQISFVPNEESKSKKVGETTVTVVDDPSRIASIAGTATTTEENTSDEGGEDENTETPAPPTPPTPTPGPSTFVTEVIEITPVNDPNGTPDLTVRILEVGTVTKSGTFTAKTGKLDPKDRLAVRFEVSNEGTKDTGKWKFAAELPTEPRHTYTSKSQDTLMPGTRVEYTIGFDRAEDDDEKVRFEIEIDPDDDVDESNENNNKRTITLNIKT